MTAYASRHSFAVGDAGIPLTFAVQNTDGEGYTIAYTPDAVTVTADVNVGTKAPVPINSANSRLKADLAAFVI